MKNKISSLNGFRTISILMVIMGHFYQNNFISQVGWTRYMEFFLFNGQLGVNVFFIISGFLITHLLLVEEKKNGEVSLRKFYIRRVIRIFPAYYFLLGVYFILQIAGVMHLDKNDWLFSLTYIKQFYSTHNATGHLWSLSVEEFFYLVWPFVFLYLKRIRIYFLWLLILAPSILRFFFYSYPLPAQTNTIFSTADALLIGCLVAFYYSTLQHFMHQLKRVKYIFPILMLSVVVGSILVYKYSYHLAAVNATSTVIIIGRIAYAFLGNIGIVTNLAIAALIIYSVEIDTWWKRLLNTPAMDMIGTLSYSIYLWQQLFTQDTVFLHSFPTVVLIIFIALAACISYYFIEKPFLKLKERFSSRQEGSSPENEFSPRMQPIYWFLSRNRKDRP